MAKNLFENAYQTWLVRDHKVTKRDSRKVEINFLNCSIDGHLHPILYHLSLRLWRLANNFNIVSFLIIHTIQKQIFNLSLIRIVDGLTCL